MSQLVAANLRRIRAERGYSLGELSRRAGLSKQTLSSVEQGDANPTLDTIGSIADALEVPFRALTTEWGSATRLVRGGELDWQQEGRFARAKLVEAFGSGRVRAELRRLEPEPRPVTIPPESTGTIHHVYVLAGRIEAGAEHELELLDPGDHLSFPADRPHRMRALDSAALIHLTTTSPQRAQFLRA